MKIITLSADLFRISLFSLLILLFTLLPSIFLNNLISPSQTAKTFIFLYVMIVAAVFFVLYFLSSENRYANQITVADFILHMLFGYLLINWYLLQGLVDFSFHIYELLGLVLLYIIIRLTGLNVILWFLLALIAGGLLQAFYGNLQLYGVFDSLHRDFSITGSFYNPGPYAGYLISVFPVALGLWLFRNRFTRDTGDRPLFFEKNSILAYTGFAAGAVILLVLPATQSRAAMLAAVAGSAYLLYHRYGGAELLSRVMNTPLRKMAAVSLIVLILAGMLGGAYLIKKDSADGRILIWKATSLMIQDNPVTGLGYDRFRAGYMDAQAAYFQENPDDPAVSLAANSDYAFNEILQFTAEQGFVGLFLLGVLGMLIVRTTDPAHSIWLIISKAGILSVFVFSLFSYPSQILPIKINVVLFLAIVASFGKPLPMPKLFSIPPAFLPWLKGSVMVLVFTGATAGVLHLNELRSAAKSWKLGLDLYNSGNILQGILAYERAEPVFNRNGDFLMNHGKALSMAGDHDRAVTVLHEAEKHLNNTIIQTALGDSYKALGRFEEAEEAYLLATHMLPDRFYPKYLLANLYEETGNSESALQLAHELIRKKPKVPTTAVEEIKEEMLQLAERISNLE